MKCSACGNNMMITGNRLESPKETDKIDIIQTLSCTNVDCTLYAGKDLDKHKQTVRNAFS